MGGDSLAMTTVTCVFVQGEYAYTREYVIRLHAMVSRWMDRSFRFVCLTDQPWLFVPPIETIAVQKLPGFAPWTKLELFNPIRRWTGRVLYLDLDSLIVAPLAPILDVAAGFAITADPRPHSRPTDGFGRKIVRRFNSSVMVWDGGTMTTLYTDWTREIGARLSGDQDWIGEYLPTATTMPRAWFPRISEVKPPWPSEAKVVLCKQPKNHDAVRQWPELAAWWGGEMAATV
jgi:hypothetical protein